MPSFQKGPVMIPRVRPQEQEGSRAFPPMPTKACNLPALHANAHEKEED